MDEATSLLGVVREIKEEETLRSTAQRAARFAPKITIDPCPKSPTGAHHWKYRTGGAASKRTCVHCQEKR